MRITAVVGALTLLGVATLASAQTDPVPTPQPHAQPSGSMIMCGAPATTGQGQDKTDKPVQMSMMCPCCQNMMKGKGMMPKKQSMPGMDHH